MKKKRYQDMSAAELAIATREYDEPGTIDRTRPMSPSERAEERMAAMLAAARAWAAALSGSISRSSVDCSPRLMRLPGVVRSAPLRNGRPGTSVADSSKSRLINRELFAAGQPPGPTLNVVAAALPSPTKLVYSPIRNNLSILEQRCLSSYD